MPATAPYVRPVVPGAPVVPNWVPPEPTKENIDWAQLHTLDLSLLDSDDPAVVKGLVDTCKQAIREDGFLYLANYGISVEEVMRQFSIAQYTFNNLTEDDKVKYGYDSDSGVFSGYKHPFGFKTAKGLRDGIEHFNFYEAEFQEWQKLTPEFMHPLMPEITAFCTYLYTSVGYRLLKLLSLCLEMPEEFLWDTVESHGGIIGDGYYRHALFSPVKEEQEVMQRTNGLRMNGHTDHGTTTLLFSTPISCLQIFCKDNKWRYVKYAPGALVVNIGETLEIISGGHFKATFHRVYRPPADQSDKQRLSIVQFNASAGNARAEPAMQSPLLQREGCVEDQGVYCQFKALRDKGIAVPTNKEWREIHIAQPVKITDQPDDFEIVDGVKYRLRNYFGVKVLLPC